ncbi:MAG: acetate--CoA ligase family protein [Xanthomonadales bacterium]|nr:acetate--CoA ligase family protein [Xanthomonadales bacterium]
MKHRLDPLLRPRSIAVVGASERAGSVGRRTVQNLLLGRFDGDLYAVNPGYDSVLGVPCFPSLDDLPNPVQHVIFTLGDRHIEAAVEAAIRHGALAATIMSQLVLAEDAEPLLIERLRARVREAGMLVCGGNAMGFYNFADGVWACGFDTRENHRREGHVTLLAQSGAGMSGILDCEERIDFNLAASTGQELSVGLHDYMDFAIEVLEPRVVGLFMEAVRDPGGMMAVLEKANRRRIPVVAIKVGKSRLSARLVQSHSGALAGEDSAFEALFDRYGVQRVADMDELATALILFAQPHPVGTGGLATIHDSGGERQLLIDLAEEMSVPFAALSSETVKKLRHRLDPGLPAVNPLDAWGAGGPDSDQVMQDCLAAMMADPDCAFGAVVHDRAPLGRIYPEYIDYLRAGHAASGKPVALVANRQGSGSDPVAVEVTRQGFPVIDGVRPFLAGIRALFAWRDFQVRPVGLPRQADQSEVLSARALLTAEAALDEEATLGLLASFGLPVNPGRIASSHEEVFEAAQALGYPVVLKTAQPGIAHKAEQGGVCLDIRDDAALSAAWDDISSRLGPRVLVAPMLKGDGVEMALGMVHDEQFGPLVMLGFGGARLQALNDVVFAMPPFSEADALRHLQRLRHQGLLRAPAGAPPPDFGAFCHMAAQFSVMVHALAGDIRELDINPVIVNAEGCIAADALLVGRGQYNKQQEREHSP